MIMYFVDQEHKKNYLWLLEKKGLNPGDDSEYEAAYYITAHPEIFKCFDWDVYKLRYSPLGDLLFNDDEDSKGADPGVLTGATWQLVKIGQSMFNGYKIDLSDFPFYNEEMFNVFIQTCKLRGRI
uniref:hypothetical protein n=1 Tax=Bacillus multifaciens TaxID=3068506 RepID=UPI003F499AF9